jgi:hypothetical protein
MLLKTIISEDDISEGVPAAGPIVLNPSALKNGTVKAAGVHITTPFKTWNAVWYGCCAIQSRMAREIGTVTFIVIICLIIVIDVLQIVLLCQVRTDDKWA